ncbi:MAG: hypothetical protein IJ111_00175 [Eggerthellaceae bacterium]|nr:hypothetical protein [Eggerthellaceae bacterium]
MASGAKTNALPIIIAGLVVCGLPAYVLATLFGAGPVAMIAMMVSLFTFISIIGGSLVADMKVAAVLAPLIFVAATVPRIVSEWNAIAGAVVACAFMLVVVLLPLHDERLGNARMGAGMAVIFSYAMALPGEFNALQFVAAIAVAVVWPVLLRLVMGARDPDKATRESIAGLLDAEEPDLEGALHAWLLGGRKLWQAKVIAAACRSRGGMHMLRLLGLSDNKFEGLISEYGACAAQVADQVRAKAPDESRVLELPETDLSGEERRMADKVSDGLAEAHAAAVERPAGTTTRPTRESLRAIAGKPMLRERKVQIRHAVRTFIGMSVMIVLTTVLLPPGGSLKASALLCTFAILQSSWHATLAKSKARIIGVSLGMVASAALTAVLTAEALMPVAMVCMLLGMWFMLSNPTLAYFFMAVMSIGMAVGTRGVDPGTYIVEYLVVIAAAIVVGVIGGFAIVRPVPHPSLRESVDTMWGSVICVLETLRDNADRPIVLTEAFTEFSAASDELRCEHAGSSAESGQREQVDRFALACLNLVLFGIDDVLVGRGAIGEMVARAKRVSFDGSADAPPHAGQLDAAGLVAHADQLGALLYSQQR